jgi:hypothetical protein
MVTSTPSLGAAQPAVASAPAQGSPAQANPASPTPPAAPRSLFNQSVSAKPPGGTAPQRTQAPEPNGSAQAAPQNPATQLGHAMQEAMAKMHESNAQQQMLFSANNQSQLTTSDLNQKGQIVGAVTSGLVQTAKDLAESSKSSAKALGDAFQRA